ncbi:MAG TPA: GGDEF domain-containing protein [Thermoleophilaceae bacterium]|mgnify:CR=1 FL=1
MTQPLRAAQEFLLDMFGHRADPYEGADLGTSQRIVAALLGLNGVLVLLFLPLEPVDEQIGSAGWLLAGAIIAAAFAGAVLVARRSPSFDDLLVIGYLGAAAIATLNWLAAGGSSAYEDLYVLWLGAVAPHPPRRAFALLAVMLGVLALPLAYQGTKSAIVGDMVAEALLLTAVGSILITYLHLIRRQRLGLRAGAEVARRLASVDALTGLGNRRAFDEALTVEVAGAARDRAPLSIGLIDVDSLKSINDRFGHLEGDRCLGNVARVMESSVRNTDRCFRWGGDEFVVVLPGSRREAAEDVMRRMVEKVNRECTAPDGRGVELSWGSAELAPGASLEDALAAADVALLEQKTEKRR